ncbi:MAG: TonB-dependent receptor [Rubrivivax sp.]|nr:TonB-dependent receptor [Rubrivivax sp.]
MGSLVLGLPAAAQEAPRPAASAPASASSAAGTSPSPASEKPAATTAPATGRPASAASAPAAAASAPAAAPQQRIEITGGRDSDTETRRRSTAAKIVIGREEIEKFGDATVGEVLRRLPGVTTPGAPGRGGPPRLRGLGSGYTQLLIDGQRLPPGFSLDSLTPEQIERIEILRAPTAETGARAIAGTINIVTREGFRRRLNDLRLGFGTENGGVTPGLNVVRNDAVDELIYNVSLSVFLPQRITDSDNETLLVRRDDGSLVEQASGTLRSEEKRTGVALTSRLQWRLGETGDMFIFMPHLFHSEGRTDRDFTRTQVPAPAPGSAYYDSGTSDTTNHFTSLRLNGQWRQRLGPAVRMELNGGVGSWRAANNTQRTEFQEGVAGPTRFTDELGRTRERSLNLTAKFSGVAVPGARGAAFGAGTGGPPPPAEHHLVGGLEIEGARRDELRVFTDGGVVQAAEFGDTFEASTLRLAAYLQDEWNLDAHWAFHAGLRWEGIRTQGDAGDGTRPANTSSVTTPLVHLLWKPDPARRDQVRLSLTRSYRAPTTQSLIARPSINSSSPASGPNDPTRPDTAGNPELRPERAIGLDLAFERYLDGGGVLSSNTFYRHVRDLMRRVTTLEAVSWSPVQRYVAREQNIGDATTMGLELEAKYRLEQLVTDAPRVELRHNVAFYRSRVGGVPGPDNRLDQQARATANIGADYRLRALPLTLGGNLNLVPGYRTQLADDRAVTVSSKRVFDAFALWTFSPAVGLRVLANNLAPRDYANRTEFDYVDPGSGVPLRETATTRGPSWLNLQLRLELKL